MSIIYLFSFILLAFSYSTVNSLVPKPTTYREGERTCRLNEDLTIEQGYSHCLILNGAVEEFRERLKNITSPHLHNKGTSCSIDKLTITITDGCNESSDELWPSEKMKESYTVIISNKKIEITSTEVWGTLHALQTVLQLAHRNALGTLVINETTIEDSPQFSHRGFVVNTAAHFISVEVLENFLDAMAFVKMNVFHWHITDDSSFPYESSTDAQLSRMGAYHQVLSVYGKVQVEQLLNYARLRGIRVVVEFDTPSHTRSWEKGHPGLRTQCYTEGVPNGRTGPFDPTNKTTMEFLRSFFKEITSRFPERFIHLGGDDVSFECWQSNPEILEFMRTQGFGEDFGKLESYYFDQLITAIQSVQQKRGSITPVVWEDAFENGYRPKKEKNTVFQVWKDWIRQERVKNITSAGYRVILSSCFRIFANNYVEHWKPYYKCDPRDFSGSEQEKKLVIGGEAFVVGNFVDETILFTRSWPEGAVVAERLWSQGDFDIDEFIPRLTKLRCLMLDFGLNAKPLNEPKSCLQL